MVILCRGIAAFRAAFEYIYGREQSCPAEYNGVLDASSSV
jgi:hypothetical protein